MKPVNILFLHSHNTGRYVQPFGHAVPTPNLQRLAQEGVLFRHAFAAAPTCSPSRASFMTGQYPHSCGMLGLEHRGFHLAHPDRHVAHFLKNHGYLTSLAGVEHTTSDLTQVGYQTVLSNQDTNYAGTCDHPDAAEAAATFLRSGPQQPFFLSVGLNETHRPFPEPNPASHWAEDERYCLPPRPLPDTPLVRRDMAAFKASARVMDEAYGKILRALDDGQLTPNTLVCCFSDHGLQFPRNMCNLTDHGIGVYLIVRGPGGFNKTSGGAGRVADRLVSLVDLFPTVCDVAGLDAPAWLQGKSLVPLAEDDSEPIHDAIFGEINYHASYEPTRCVRTDRFKYIRRHDGRQRPVLPNTDDSLSKTFLLDHGWQAEPRDQEMLFDLVFDPDEVNNLAGDERSQPLLREMRARLDKWMVDTSDPLLEGIIATPAGGRVNSPDQQSPKDPATRAP